MLTIYQNFDEQVTALLVKFKENSRLIGTDQALADFKESAKFMYKISPERNIYAVAIEIIEARLGNRDY